MADKKISALTGASTPLAGTEVLPIVQSGATVKVSVSNLTLGRDVSMDNATVNGHVNVLAGDVRFDDERFVYSYAGGTVGQYQSGIYFDGSGGTQRVYLSNAEVGRWTGTDLKISNGNLIIGTSGKGIDFSATAGTGTSELLADYEEGTWTPTDGSGAGLSFTSVEGTYTKFGRLVTCFFALTFPATASASSARISGLPFTVPAGTSGLNDAIFTVNTSGLVIQPYATNNATNFAALLTYTGSGATNVQLTAAVLRGSITYSV